MTASICGCIKNPQGDPIAGISVKLIHEPTGSAFAKTTDASGQYRFTSVRVGGPYELSINRQDADIVERKSIHLKVDEIFVHDFTL